MADKYWRFEGTCCLYIQIVDPGDEDSRASPITVYSCTTLEDLKMKPAGLAKTSLFICQTIQKTQGLRLICIVTTMRISNPIHYMTLKFLPFSALLYVLSFISSSVCPPPHPPRIWKLWVCFLQSIHLSILHAIFQDLRLGRQLLRGSSKLRQSPEHAAHKFSCVRLSHHSYCICKT